MIVDNNPYVLTCADAREWLGMLPEGSVHLTVTDPPYASLEEHRSKGTTTRLKVSEGSSNRWFPCVPDAYFQGFFHALYRAHAKGSHVYVFTDNVSDLVIRLAAREAGFHYWNAIRWVKPRMGMGYHYRRKHETILFFEKGKSKRQLHDKGIPDVMPWRDGQTFAAPVKRPPADDLYPTEKPWDLIRILVEQSSEPGEVVIDPFMGSGSTGEAALRASGGPRRFHGCDVTDDAMATAAVRLRHILADVAPREAVP